MSRQKPHQHHATNNLSAKQRIIAGYRWYDRLARTRAFELAALGVGILALVGTTLWWSILGARLQNGNADQAVIPFLFKNPEAMHQDYIPGAHSFLLKWPFFWLAGALHNPATGLIVATVSVVMITVLALMFVLWRLERRPVVLGVWYMVLASVLLLTPPFPAPGNLLPVNMAMLSTRNIEYAIFMLAVWLVIRYARGPLRRNWQLWVGIVLLGLLAASDKLFIPLILGGAAGALLLYALGRGWRLVTASAWWLVSGIVASILGIVLLAVLGSYVHIVQEGNVSPFAFTAAPHQLVLAALYTLVAVATNSGGLPAPTSTLLMEVPRDLLHHLWSGWGLAILVNLSFLVLGVAAAALVIGRSVRHKKHADVVLEPSHKFVLVIVWSALAAAAAFIFTNHYYAGDARYLGITLVALLLSAVLIVSKRDLPNGAVALVGLLALAGIALAIPPSYASYQANQAFLAKMQHRNRTVAAALSLHGTNVLVGDYWRVTPTKLLDSNNLSIVPLQSCTDERMTLTRADWHHDLTKTRFAYLLSFDKGLTDFPRCSLEQVLAAFGKPNASAVTAGTIMHPTEMVLFYDHGARRSQPTAAEPIRQASTVSPISITDYPYKVCSVPTIMNIVAHEDDDLLFMNPDLSNDIHGGHCVRTVYMTAGDSGMGEFYWLGRMRGSEAAYDHMIGRANVWVERLVKINLHEYITIANPRGNTNVSLVFVYLPDGNLKGQGFADTKYQSLEKLQSGSIDYAETVYGGSFYSAHEITQLLTSLMDLFQPSEIRTQSNFAGTQFVDHSDHRAVGQFAARAAAGYDASRYGGKVQLPVTYYLGYATHELPVNLSADIIAQKSAVFKAYGQYDGGVCRGDCMADPAYGAYLVRQHTWSY